VKKIFCILLASLLLITVAVSCADNKAEGQTTENTSEAVKTSVESTSTQEENSGETTTDDIGTTAVDTTEVGTTEADTAEPEKTTAPDESIAVIPDESYVGRWVSYPYVNDGGIYIYSVDSESVSFSVDIVKGPCVKGTAIKQDGEYVFGENITTDLEYSLYGYGSATVSGRIKFYKNGVFLGFDDIVDNSLGKGCNIKIDSIKKRDDTVEQIKTDFNNKGWTDIVVDLIDYNRDSDWLDKKGHKWCENVDPYMPQNALVTSVIGKFENRLCVVRVVYDREADDWFAADVFYAHNDGRVLQGDELKAFMLNHGKTDFILPADDVDLLEYFK